MIDKPFMPKATAVWLVENTKISFKQIADFCNLHELEVKGIADGDVAKGIKAYNPILAGQLTREEIEASSKDNNRPLVLNKKILDINEDRFQTIPMSEQLCDNMRAEKNIPKEKLDYINEIDEWLHQQRKIYEKAV